MKKFLQCVSVLAVTATVGLSAVGFSAVEPVSKLGGEFTITAEAANAWYPSSVTVNAAENYQKLLAQNPSSSLLYALKKAAGETNLNGNYSQRRIVYTKLGSYNNVVMMYDKTKHPELDKAFFGTSTQKQRGKQWITSYLQMTSTMKQLSGTNLPYVVLLLDESVNNSCAGYINDTNGSLCSGYVRYNAGASNGLEACITCDSEKYFFNWTTLHETGHLYSLENESLFNTHDDVYCNLTALCAVRALKQNGVAFPDLLRDNSSGAYTFNGKKFEAVSAMKYAETSMKSEYNTFKTKTNANDIPSNQFFFSLGLLFKLAFENQNVNPFGTSYVLDNALSSQYNAAWTNLYAMCICNINNVNASFMSGTLSPYTYYRDSRNKTITYKSGTESVTTPVYNVITSKFTKTGNQWQCTQRQIRAFDELYFLHSSNYANFVNTKMPGNNYITYADYIKAVFNN